MKTVVVTGASAGVGRATAVAFAARGDRVALIARGEEGLAGRRARGPRRPAAPRSCCRADVADADAVEAAAARAEDELGPIDVWVNCAMAAVLAFVHETDAADVPSRHRDHVPRLRARDVAALRRMRPRDRGVIVQVGSTLAYRAIPLQAPTAPPSSPSGGSPTRCAPSCCTRAAASG